MQCRLWSIDVRCYVSVCNNSTTSNLLDPTRLAWLPVPMPVVLWREGEKKHKRPTHNYLMEIRAWSDGSFITTHDLVAWRVDFSDKTTTLNIIFISGSIFLSITYRQINLTNQPKICCSLFPWSLVVALD